MAIFDANGAKAGSLVAAAMESAGQQIQSRMLDFVAGSSGQTIAGFLFLVGIVGAVFVLAIGGSYKWGRYLMVGPALFFFFTQVRTASNGTDWQFADHNFARSHVSRALEGVAGYESGDRGGSDVSLFFHFWNVFMSDITQNMMTLLRLTQDKSHLDFISKVERYMHIWVFQNIDDQNLRMFIHLVLVNQCADYYLMKKALNDPHVDDVLRATYQTTINERSNVRVFRVWAPVDDEENELMRYLTEELEWPEGEYTCDDVWQGAVMALQRAAPDSIERSFNNALGPDQLPADVYRRMLQAFGGRTGRHTGQVELNQDAQLLQLVDFVVARSLWQTIGERNRYTEYFNQEGHSAIFATQPTNGMFGARVSNDPTHNMVQQFNRTEMWQFKGDFVNAALALPHFQGVILLLLSASYPFFAMAMVLPGRAGAMLLWMGLWAWVKLWDLGFAVVMMIDNILFVMFPRSPSLSPGDISDPGRAWARILEVDPNYSATVYYNLIATCLFAVPAATALFVKGGGAELIGVVQSAFEQSSQRLAGAAVTYARSRQAQSYVGRQRRGEVDATAQALHDVMYSRNVREAFMNFVALEAGGEAAQAMTRSFGAAFNNAELRQAGEAGGAAVAALNRALSDQQKSLLQSFVTSYAAARRFEQSISQEAFFASESAVAARFYSHDTAIGLPGAEFMSLHVAGNYYNTENVATGQVEGTLRSGGGILSFLLGPGGAR